VEDSVVEQAGEGVAGREVLERFETDAPISSSRENPVVAQSASLTSRMMPSRVSRTPSRIDLVMAAA
jgi:hypothetical protein